jgi:hypothetical protein
MAPFVSVTCENHDFAVRIPVTLVLVTEHPVTLEPAMHATCPDCRTPLTVPIYPDLAAQLLACGATLGIPG